MTIPESSSASSSYLRDTYSHRFSEQELASKRVLWRTLCEHEFQQYVPPSGAVLDLGAGYCEFINSIRAGRKIAVDLNPDTAHWAAADVHVLQRSSDDLGPIANSTINTVFTSNFFEHLPSTQSLLATLSECHRVLTQAGLIVVLMPNIRNIPGKYWDYLDHHLPLTHWSLVEALELSGFQAVRVEPRYLPYTVRGSKLPIRPLLIRAYLHAPPMKLLLGKQMLVVARKAL